MISILSTDAGLVPIILFESEEVTHSYGPPVQAVDTGQASFPCGSVNVVNDVDTTFNGDLDPSAVSSVVTNAIQGAFGAQASKNARKKKRAQLKKRRRLEQVVTKSHLQMTMLLVLVLLPQPLLDDSTVSSSRLPLSWQRAHGHNDPQGTHGGPIW